MNQALIKSGQKAGRGLGRMLPIILGVVLLISFLTTAIPQSAYMGLLQSAGGWGLLWADLIGSVAAGNPITSYLIGGNLYNDGASLLVVTAFLVAWVTAGVVQLPVEAPALGLKFAVWRNITSFVLVIGVALVTVFLFNLL